MRMLISRRVLASAASILLILPSIAAAETWPTRPITLICPFGAGGAPDIIARFVAQELGDKLGQKVVVEDRTGASGNIGTARRRQVHARWLHAAAWHAEPAGDQPADRGHQTIVRSRHRTHADRRDWKVCVDTGHAAPVEGEDVAGPGRGGEGQSRRHECRRCLTSAPAATSPWDLLMQVTRTKFAAIPYRGTPPLADLIGGQIDVAIHADDCLHRSHQ